MSDPNLPRRYIFIECIGRAQATGGKRVEAHVQAWRLPNPNAVSTWQVVARTGGVAWYRTHTAQPLAA